MGKEKFGMTRRKVVAFIVAILILILALFSFYVFRYKYYVVYGIMDSMRRAEKDILVKTEYDGSELSRFLLSDVEAGESDAVFTTSLWLVNSEYMLDPEEELYLVDAGDEHRVTAVAYENLQKLFSDCLDKTGEVLSITSSYRSYEKQEEIYAVNQFAVKPGASEHQCGLAVDIRTKNHASLRFIMSSAGKWVAENAHNYGFIIRYPYWAEDITGVTYEPWHIRYVGVPHAEIIYRAKIAFEDYASLYEYGEFYSYSGYTISRQTGEDGYLVFPSGMKNIFVSSDNTGAYFIWGETAE